MSTTSDRTRAVASELPDVHLDLGCGSKPRNPYARSCLCGVDIRGVSSAGAVEFRAANLSIDPIPWPADHFGSVSAFDFLEHVPRVLVTPDGRGTFFPFIRLMNEVWRVLAPGGLLYALTPAFPHPDAFVDPTHVNFITDRTHEYFCGSEPLARMYGFDGEFRARRVEWAHVQQSYNALQRSETPMPVHAKPKPVVLHRRMARGVRDTVRMLRGAPIPIAPQRPYILWEFEAVKPQGARTAAPAQP